MLLKPATAATTALLVLVVLIAAVASAVIHAFTSAPNPSALSDIPAPYLRAYLAAAATCPGLDWTVLAAIGKIETDHGRARMPGVHTNSNPSGAQGPMQFLPATFAHYARPVPPGGTTPPSPYDPVDAIHAAARMLCANGARDGRNLTAALWNYNHSARYRHDVLAQAHAYATATVSTVSAVGSADCVTLQAPTPAAFTALNYACGQRGLPYVWGGNGPSDGGFDCSGLTTAAYAAAGITLPRTADTQYRAGPPVPGHAPLFPGDLVFYGTRNRIHHVGLYLGNGRMIDAPDVGKVVTIEAYRWNGDDYLGATRPEN